jgi:hypothetical protein
MLATSPNACNVAACLQRRRMLAVSSHACNVIACLQRCRRRALQRCRRTRADSRRVRTCALPHQRQRPTQSASHAAHSSTACSYQQDLSRDTGVACLLATLALPGPYSWARFFLRHLRNERSFSSHSTAHSSPCATSLSTRRLVSTKW